MWTHVMRALWNPSGPRPMREFPACQKNLGCPSMSCCISIRAEVRGFIVHGGLWNTLVTGLQGSLDAAADRDPKCPASKRARES